jgi:lipopolysaccharide export LptBFGC system permease protein LptF
MKILDRYLLREIVPVFLLAAGTFVVLLLGHMLYTVVEVVVERRVPLPSVMKFLLLRLPEAASMAIPVSALLATALCFNRLAGDRELPALRAGGASFFRMMLPPLVFGVLCAAAVFFLNEQLAPRCEEASRRLLVETISQRRSLAFQPGRFLQLSDNAWALPGDVDPHRERLTEVHLFLLRGTDPPILLKAPEAVFMRDELVISRAMALIPEWSGDITWGSVGNVRVSLQPEAFDLPGDAGQLREMSLRQLWQSWRSQQTSSPSAARRYSLELHSRLAIAAAALVFALLGGPLTLVAGRGQTLSGVALSLVVVFAYYLLTLWSRLLGERSILSPFLAAWGLNGFLLVFTAWLVYRLR